MLSFAVYTAGKLAERVNVSGAYVIGSDDVPLRAEVTAKDGIIHCKKRTPGPAALVVLWKVPEVGEILTETVRLLERDKPYILQVELARGRLMRIAQKVEEWGLLDYEGTEPIIAQVRDARELLIEALKAETPAEMAATADRALALAVQAGEALARFHADVFLTRRKQIGGFPKRVLGCSIDLEKSTEIIHKRLVGSFDFVTVPVVWRDIEPTEQTFNWKPLDAWVEVLTKQRLPIKGSTLLSFHEKNVPDWLYIWEHDFDTIRDLAFEHVRRVINRYGQYIQVWDVISGIHATNCFTFNFEQLMELTRMAAALTKQASPRSTAIVNLVAPWGEYYARNQRTIPPLLYADMAIQSGVNFDAFGLQFYFGPGTDGMFVRDMFQISSMIDAFGRLGKPLHITAVQVPSAVSSKPKADQDTERPGSDGGSWRGPWNEEIQSEWLEQFFSIALSKPFVDTVSWRGLTDNESQEVPYGGLLSSGMAPKAAYDRLMQLRADIRGGKQTEGGSR
jgi:hypothetical protein